MSASFTARFVTALTARNAEQFSRDTESAIKQAERCKVALDAIMSEPHFAELRNKLIRQVRIATAQQDRSAYIAVKVVQKLISTLYAMQVGQVSQLDNYTYLLGKNLCKLSDMTNKSNYASLSKSIEYDALDRVQAIERAPGRGYTVGTASAQSAQVRQVVRILGIADSVKGKRDDTMVLLNNARAEQFVKLYGKTLAQVETQEGEAEQEAEELSE